MHIKKVLTAAVASTVWSSTAFAFAASQEAHGSPGLRIAFASHKPLMSGEAGPAAMSQRPIGRAVDERAVEASTSNDVSPDVTSIPEAVPQVAASQLQAPQEPLAHAAQAAASTDVSPDVSTDVTSMPEGASQTAASQAPLAPVEVRALLELFMSPGDGRVSVALQRYLEEHGWQLAWEIDRDFPIEYPATFTGDFLGIVEQIVVSLQNTDAPIRVKVYEANRVLRVVHATQ
ncbi:toxin co-regulated pilus biosynthesis Q family protein [Pandoraea sp.]|uniref:toxin co-regulated pilus biosynthesis Q family protein n=1 Tax=Pandoraea sp. TaxID=1883445 RepID=UPI0035B442DA